MTGRSALALALLAALLAVVDACNTTQVCCGECPASRSAEFTLTCSSTDLQSVVATGPCAVPDASLASYVGSDTLLVPSQGPGDCHVELTFATGFTYSADVTFVSKPGGVCGGPQCKCGDYIVPTSGPFTVNNPSTTCVDAAASDGAADASACPADAGQSVPCAQPGTCAGCRLNVAFECTCSAPTPDAAGPDAEAGGLQWQCIDTGFPCTKGSP
jgi:hypothetical protein